jgi:hypothetical protein
VSNQAVDVRLKQPDRDRRGEGTRDRHACARSRDECARRIGKCLQLAAERVEEDRAGQGDRHEYDRAPAVRNVDRIIDRPNLVNGLVEPDRGVERNERGQKPSCGFSIPVRPGIIELFHYTIGYKRMDLWMDSR